MAMDQNNLWTGFQMPRRLAVDGETLTERYGRFSAQPFERGFGTTIGNSLRRALLSSIEGAAITAVKIEGVEHEFSSIRGVVEDATDVILNLKQIPIKLHGNQAKTLTITRDGAGAELFFVRGGWIKICQSSRTHSGRRFRCRAVSRWTTRL